MATLRRVASAIWAPSPINDIALETQLRLRRCFGGPVSMESSQKRYPAPSADGAPFLRLNTIALVGMSAAGKAMGDEERKRVVEEIVGESAPTLQQYSDGPGLAFELSTNVATAKG